MRALAIIFCFLASLYAVPASAQCNQPDSQQYYITSDYNSGTQVYSIAGTGWVTQASDGGYLAYVASGCKAETVTVAQLLAGGGPIEQLKVSQNSAGNSIGQGFPIISAGTANQVMINPMPSAVMYTFTAAGHTVSLPPMAAYNAYPIGQVFTVCNGAVYNSGFTFTLQQANGNSIDVISPQWCHDYSLTSNTNSAGTITSSFQTRASKPYAVFLENLLGALPASGAALSNVIHTCAAHTWDSSVTNTLTPSCTQPAIGDLSSIAANTFVGNNTGGATTPAALTVGQSQTLLEQGLTLISVNTIVNAASYSDTTSITSAYDDYQIYLDDCIPAGNGVELELLVHSNGAFQNTSYVNAVGGATTYFGITGTTTVGNVDGLSGVINILGVNSSVHKKIRAVNAFITSTSTAASNAGSGIWAGGVTAIDGFQLLANAGNITSCGVKVYGLRKAM